MTQKTLYPTFVTTQKRTTLMPLLLCVFLLILDVNLPTAVGKELCTTCNGIVDKVHEGIKKTAKSNFGGGNTRWEEESLGKYQFSETRLLEIIEDVCDSSSKECHQLVEEHEELMEKWWFKEFAKGTDTDLYQYFCIDNVKVCCPSGTYGPECKDCRGGRTRFCNGNGNCLGNGTRTGSGDCSCYAGYSGDMCDECKEGYYEEVRNETHIVCTKCDNACKTSCFEGGTKGCDDCKDGWEYKEDEGCFDIDECEKEDTCKEEEYCTNSPGSYKCQSCDDACIGCTGSGPGSCKACKEHFFEEDSICKACHTSCKTSCTDGSPKSCDECKDGWMNTEDKGCIDVDECSVEPSPCKENEYCVNNEGSYQCPTCHHSCQGCTGEGIRLCKECRTGYERNNESEPCSDINECEDGTVCPSEYETCINKPGTYKCACLEGYERKAEQCVKVEKVEKPQKGGKKSKVKKGKKKSKKGKNKKEAADTNDESDSDNEEKSPTANSTPSPTTTVTDAPPTLTEGPPTITEGLPIHEEGPADERKDEL